jgi:hypothetical protein
VPLPPQIMASLGLFDEDVALAALLRQTRGEAGGKGGKGGRKRVAPAPPDADAAPPQPQRRSRRVAALVRHAGSAWAGYSATPHAQAPAAALSQESGEPCAEVADELRATHEAEAAQHAARHAGRQQRASCVGTASYEHTLMRCASAARSPAHCPACLHRSACHACCSRTRDCPLQRANDGRGGAGAAHRGHRARQGAARRR